jgi:hypothetical protein
VQTLSRSVLCLQTSSDTETIDELGPSLKSAIFRPSPFLDFSRGRGRLVRLTLVSLHGIHERRHTSMTAVSFSSATTMPVITGIARCFLNSNPVCAVSMRSHSGRATLTQASA